MNLEEAYNLARFSMILDLDEIFGESKISRDFKLTLLEEICNE